MNELSFAGPSFSIGPQPPSPTITTPKQVTPPPSPKQKPPVLPPRPLTEPPKPPQGKPPDTSTTTTRSLRDTGHTSTTGKTKTRIQLLQQAKGKANTFLGKYCFGTLKKLIDVLPSVKDSKSTHRDYNFVQGEIKLARYLRQLR